MSAIEIRDSRFSLLVSTNARLDVIHEGMFWAEGPVWFGDRQSLIWSDIPNNVLWCWHRQTGAYAYRRPSGFANGNTRDKSGRLVSCEHGGRRVTRTDFNGSITVLADAYRGKRLNSPNDVVVSSDHTVWFTDPNYGIRSDYEGNRAEQEQAGCYVYRIDPVSGELKAMLKDFEQPNGLAFSPDETWLYVADSGEPHHIRAFRVGRQGKLSGGEVFAQIDAGVPDGFRVDSDGNLWVSAADGVHCFSPEGDLLGKVHVPEIVSNLSFGGERNNDLFITATSRLYRIRLGCRGL